MKRTAPPSESRFTCSLSRSNSSPSPPSVSVTGLPPARSLATRFDQQVGALDAPEFADIGHIAGIVGLGNRFEFLRRDAVEDATHKA